MVHPRSILLVFALAVAAPVPAQDDTLQWAVYHTGFGLKEGIYADFMAFRMDRPTVPKERLRDTNGLPVLDIRKVVSKVTWQPDTGGVVTIRKDALWGFCQNDAVYIAAGNGFYRLGITGSLSHMLYEMSYRDWDPYMYPYGGVTRTILMQQMLDMVTGEFLPFNAAGMDRALQHDPVLLEEFRALPKKQRNKDEVLFRFLRMYNERHPLRFPR